MSKINQIQNGLKELDGGAFQKLADSFLTRKGYGPIYAIGSVIGANKTKAGTPDTLAKSKNGKYVLVEYTTIDKQAAREKFSDDINKCLDEAKTSIPLRDIEEVILCYSKDMDAADISELRKKCLDKGVNISIFTNSSISFEILEKYPSIAKDHLSVDIDTQQIVSLKEFLRLYERHDLATPLSTKFYFRESEKDLILDSIRNNKITIVSGKAGVGKSRLAIECYEEFSAKNPDYKAYCIFNKSRDIYDDVRTYFSDSGKYLVFVDDANRASGFQYIIDALIEEREDQDFKIIVTVRDYATDKIQNACKPISSSNEISVNQFTNEEIKTLLRDEFEILHHDYLERIVKVSQGNPRLAIMAAKVAKTENTLESISDISGLYDVYFSSIKDDLLLLSDKKVLAVAGIIAFMGSVDVTREDQMNVVHECFDLSKEEFWEAAVILHNMELADIFENEIVKISDQILSTYFFYMAFIKEKYLDYSVVLEKLFPMYKGHIVDSLNPVINSFDYKYVTDSIRGDVDKVWGNLEEYQSDEFEEFLKLFWFLKPTDTLIYIRDRVEEVEYIEVGLDNLDFESNRTSELPSFMSVVSNFRNMDSERIVISIDLLLSFAEKRKDLSRSVLHTLTEEYGFQLDSHRRGYSSELEIAKRLIAKCDGGKNHYVSMLFLQFAVNFLNTQFRRHSESDGRSITISTIELRESEALRSIRNMIYENVFELYEVPELKNSVIQFLMSHSNNWSSLSSKDIVEKDADLVLCKFESHLNGDSIDNCIAVNDYKNLLIRFGIEVDPKIFDKFQSRMYKLYDLFTNKFEKRDMELPLADFEEYKKAKVGKYTESFDVNEYLNTFSELRSVIAACRGRDNWQLGVGVESIFESLSEHTPKFQ